MSMWDSYLSSISPVVRSYAQAVYKTTSEILAINWGSTTFRKTFVLTDVIQNNRSKFLMGISQALGVWMTAIKFIDATARMTNPTFPNDIATRMNLCNILAQTIPGLSSAQIDIVTQTLIQWGFKMPVLSESEAKVFASNVAKAQSTASADWTASQKEWYQMFPKEFLAQTKGVFEVLGKATGLASLSILDALKYPLLFGVGAFIGYKLIEKKIKPTRV